MSDGDNPKSVPTESAPDSKPNQITAPRTKKNLFVIIREKPLILGGLIAIVLAIIVSGFLYWKTVQSRVYIEKSEIWAPIISLSPDNSGAINEIYVKEGDIVAKDQPLIKIGTHVVTPKTGGLILWVGNTPGQMASPQSVVVKMLDLNTLRVIGHIDEDKGLSDIKIGQKVIFTVDAYGDQEYQGIVERIGASANQSSIVFSISDQRAENPFDITVTYDIHAYPELKDGMSARMWIYK